MIHALTEPAATPLFRVFGRHHEVDIAIIPLRRSGEKEGVIIKSQGIRHCLSTVYSFLSLNSSFLPLFQLETGRKYPQTRDHTSHFSPHV